MSQIEVTPEAMELAKQVLARVKSPTEEYAEILSAVPDVPKLPLAVTLAVGLANAVSKTEAAATGAKASVKGFAAQFKAAYRERRPVEVKVVKAADVSPEELAAALEILKAQQQNAQ